VLKQHAKLSRLEKPDKGKRTSEACKETDQRRLKEKELLSKTDKGIGIRI
jgi:hypothetical protein